MTFLYVYFICSAFIAGFTWSALYNTDEPEFDDMDISAFFVVIFAAILWPLIVFQMLRSYLKKDSK